MPYLEKESNFNEAYNVLFDILAWLESYERILRKTGMGEADYSNLKFVDFELIIIIILENTIIYALLFRKHVEIALRIMWVEVLLR